MPTDRPTPAPLTPEETMRSILGAMHMGSRHPADLDWLASNGLHVLDATRAAHEGRNPVTHGRHCRCSACARQDWTLPYLAPCGIHGPSCPAEYQPESREDWEASHPEFMARKAAAARAAHEALDAGGDAGRVFEEPFDNPDWSDELAAIRERVATDHPTSDRANLLRALDAEEKDTRMLAHNLAVIYDDITGGLVSKPNTNAEVVIGLYEERLSKEIDEAVSEALAAPREPVPASTPDADAPDVSAALRVARRFDEEAFACDFGGSTAINLPNLDMVIPLAGEALR